METTTSTQQFIEIAGIQEGIAILKNGSYRMIFAVSAVNFSLKSEEEQNSLIFQYQSFLNSLHFPIQIVMRSKKLDLNPYLKKIKDLQAKQTNELIKVQTDDYIDFVSQLINLANIMKKTFYVVVGYDPITIKKPSVLDKLLNHSGPASLKIYSEEFARYKGELTERANTTVSGLGSMGLHCKQLNTEEIIELFYGIYNPEIADKERFSNVEEIDSSFIGDIKEKGQKPAVKIESVEEEAIIDNTGVVEEVQKKETKVREMGAANMAQRQMVATPPASPASPTTAPKPAENIATPPPATPTAATSTFISSDGFGQTPTAPTTGATPPTNNMPPKV